MTVAIHTLDLSEPDPPVVELMQNAVANPPGLKIIAADHTSARRLRGQMYAERARARKNADSSFDDLSITISGKEVRLIVRKSLTGRIAEGVDLVLPLRAHDLPLKIGSRGPSRLGIHEALALLDYLADGPGPRTIR